MEAADGKIAAATYTIRVNAREGAVPSSLLVTSDTTCSRPLDETRHDIASTDLPMR
jgi:hypothetical protein